MRWSCDPAPIRRRSALHTAFAKREPEEKDTGIYDWLLTDELDYDIDHTRHGIGYKNNNCQTQ